MAAYEYEVRIVKKRPEIVNIIIVILILMGVRAVNRARDGSFLDSSAFVIVYFTTLSVIFIFTLLVGRLGKSARVWVEDHGVSVQKEGVSPTVFPFNDGFDAREWTVHDRPVVSLRSRSTPPVLVQFRNEAEQQMFSEEIAGRSSVMPETDAQETPEGEKTSVLDSITFHSSEMQYIKSMGAKKTHGEIPPIQTDLWGTILRVGLGIALAVAAYALLR